MACPASIGDISKGFEEKNSSFLANYDNVIFVQVFVCLVAVLPNNDAPDLLESSSRGSGSFSYVIVMVVVVTWC